MADDNVEIPESTTESQESSAPIVAEVSSSVGQTEEPVMDEPSQAEAPQAVEDVKSSVEVTSSPACSSSGGYCCNFVGNMSPEARDLIYWRNPVKSGVVLGSSFAVLCMMCCGGFINTLAWMGLMVLTLSFVATAVGSFAKRFLGKDIPNPLVKYIDQPCDISEDKVQAIARCTATQCQRASTELRRLYCIVDIPDSFKFGITLWLVYWISSRIGFFDLLMLCDVLLFTCPKLYEVYQVQIDQAVATGKKQAMVYVDKARTMPYVDQAIKVIAPSKEKQS